jgi:hypothetical protein
LPFIVEMLKILAENGKLVDLVEKVGIESYNCQSADTVNDSRTNYVNF